MGKCLYLELCKRLGWGMGIAGDEAVAAPAGAVYFGIWI